MHGGHRVGAGRKALENSEKKKDRKIYISEELFDRVMSEESLSQKSFSQRCAILIEKGLDNAPSSLVSKTSFSDAIDAMYRTTESDLNSVVAESNLRFIDLFAGIGGIRQGFEDDKTQCVFSSEWDKFAAQTYEANYGEKPFGDITQIDENKVPDHDVLLAGFPCQPFSNIGKREGFKHETQGTLFFDILRIMDKKQPKMFLLENVKGLLTNDEGRTFDVIQRSLRERGYSIFHDVLDAQNYGLPQRRERLIIVGFHSSLDIKKFDFPKGQSNLKTSIGSVIESERIGKAPSRHLKVSEHLQKSYLFKQNDGRPQLVDLNSSIQVNTLVASYHKIQRLTGTFVKDGDTGIRLFSENELKSIMGFPNDFIVPVSTTQMYRQFGNSVAIPMIRAVSTAMKEVYFKQKAR